MGVGNVGYFQKTFFRRGDTETASRGKRMGTGNRKHRTSLMETSVLSRLNLGTFAPRSPMSLISEKGDVLNPDFADLTDFTIRSK